MQIHAQRAMEKGAGVSAVSKGTQAPAVERIEVVYVCCLCMLAAGLAQRQMAEERPQVTLYSWQPLSLAGSLQKIWPWQKEESQLLHPDNMTEMQVLVRSIGALSGTWPQQGEIIRLGRF